MDSTSGDESGRISGPPYVRTVSPMNRNYKGRVRTGCLVCRARKIKCDEQRPSCQKCTRLKKTCVYRAPNKQRPPCTPLDSNLGQMNSQEDQSSMRAGVDIALPQAENVGWIQEPPLQNTTDSGVFEVLGISDHTVQPEEDLSIPINAGVPSPTHNVADTLFQRDDPNAEPSSARLEQTSQHIYLTLTMDWLASPDVPTQSSFSYFIQEVDSPILSPFDYLNWRRIKLYIAKLGAGETLVATAILALQALYRTQADRLPIAHAMSVYQSALTGFEYMLCSDAVDFDILLVVAFLLCLSVATLPNDDSSSFNALDGVFMTRLETWLLASHHSPVSLRIGGWLQLLHTAIKRVGCPGLLSKPVSSLLYDHIIEVPSLSMLDYDMHPANSLYDIVSDPVFTFYLGLQRISNQVADLSHYRRSRTTPADQAEVADLLNGLKTNMRRLWETRPAPLRLQPSELREYFCHPIANPLTALAAACCAAYFAEVVAIGRTLGDPLVASPEAIEAMKQIRDIVEGDWNGPSGGTLSPGYLRPLFLYAIESLSRGETQWAVDHLRHIKHPISRSGFVGSLAESLGEAQRKNGRRVTMKAFCYQIFGVPLPYM